MLVQNRKSIMLLLLCLMPFCNQVVAMTGDNSDNIIRLWPKNINSEKFTESVLPDRNDGLVRVTNITHPSLQYFPAAGGGEPKPAVILCPGGAYKYLVVSKMVEIAKWLNEHNISAFVLKYRTPNKRSEAFNDLQHAIKIVRARASTWNINPNRIGIMGNSAGGHLAARVSTAFQSNTPDSEIGHISSKPNFTVLLYPAYLNKGKVLKNEFVITNKLAPTLIISARDDKRYFPGSPIYAQALDEAGVSVRTHFFDNGGHGFGLNTKIKPLSTWPNLLLTWLKDIDILKEGQQHKLLN